VQETPCASARANVKAAGM